MQPARGRGIIGFLLLGASIPLALFFTGPVRPTASDIRGPAFSIPAAGRVSWESHSVPTWWRRFDVIVRCQGSGDCSSLSAKNGEGTPLPVRTPPSPKEIVFRLTHPAPLPLRITLINSGDRTITVEPVLFRNFSVLNTGLPKFAVLLSLLPQAAFPPLKGLFLAACLCLLSGGGLFFLWRTRASGRYSRLIFWIHAGLPWGVFLTALGLRLSGRQLILSWETLLCLALPAWLALAMSTEFIKKRGYEYGFALLMVLSVLFAAATALGVGWPVQDFGPLYLYQNHFRLPVLYGGALYLLGLAALYRRKKDWLSAKRSPFLSVFFLVFCPFFLFYLSNGYSGYGGDTLFNSLLPWRLLQGEGLSYPREFVAEKGNWGLLLVGDRFLPTFPIGPGFLGLPSALIQYLFSSEPLDRLIAWNQKVTASWVAALSAAVFFRTLFISTGRIRLSLIFTLAFALGSTQTGISAGVLWQHGPAVLLLCLGLFFLVKGLKESPLWLPWAALPMAFLPIMRPQTLLYYLAALATVGIGHPGKLWRFFLWSIPGLFALLFINLGLYQNLLGGYAYQASKAHFGNPLLSGITGLLFSPNRGVLVFSPFLILGIVGGLLLSLRRCLLAISFFLASILFLLLHAKYDHWHGGWCVGPRFLSEWVPIFAFFGASWFPEIRKTFIRRAGVLSILISLIINLPPYFHLHEQGLWNLFPNVDRYRSERVWDVRDWLPFHFLYWAQVKRHQEVPAYPFVVSDAAEPLPSKTFRYRVKTRLTPEGQEILRLSQVSLKEGTYRFRIKGSSLPGTEGEARIILGFVGTKVEEVRRPFLGDAIVSWWVDFRQEKRGRVDLRLLVGGRGIIILDALSIVPLKTTVGQE